MDIRGRRTAFSGLARALARAIAVGCFAGMCSAATVLAQSSALPRATARLIWHGPAPATLLGASSRTASRVSKIDPILVSAAIPGFGRFRGVLDQQRAKNWNSYLVHGAVLERDHSRVVLLRGRFVDRLREARPFSAAIFESAAEPQISILFSSRRAYGLRHFEISGVLEAHTRNFAVRTRRVPVHALRARDRDQVGPLAAVSSASYPIEAAAFKQVELATKADYDWFQLYGSSSNSRIAANVNAAELLYENQLGLTFDIKRQVVFTSSGQNYSSTDPDGLLDEFRQQSNSSGDLGSADVYHLFTGRDLDDLYIGKAFVGTVCRLPGYSYGLSQAYNTAIDYLTFAHEVGHNFNALHDPDGSSFLMSPAVGPSNTTLSDASKTTINAFVASYGSCLSALTPTPTSTPTPQATATATAAPGSTPVPVPTSTPVLAPTSKSGGGLTPGEDPDLPLVSLEAAIEPSGEFSAQVTLNGGTTRSGCSTQLVIARDQYFDRSAYLEIGASAERSIALSAQIANRITKLSGNKQNSRVPIKAVYLCPQINFSSGSGTVLLKAARIGGTPISRNKWINRLLARVRSQL